MDKKQGQSGAQEPIDLTARPAPAPAIEGKHLSQAETVALERELGVRRRFAVVDQKRQEIGEGLYFDDLMEVDPTGTQARDAFEWEPVVIQVGEQATDVRIDQMLYFHAGTYKVRRYQLPTFNEVMYSSQRHDAEVNGRSTGIRGIKRNWGMGKSGQAVAGAGVVK